MLGQGQNWRFFVVAASFILLTGCGSTPGDVQGMLVNLSASYPAIWRLTTATAYVMGFAFAMAAVYKLRAYGEARTMMSSQASIKAPLVYLIVAVALIFSPAAYHTMLISTFGTTNTTPLSYAGTITGWSEASTEAVLGLVQVVGVIAFIRGWVYIARTGEGGGQPNNFGKGLTHIIGGLLAINIVGTKDVIWNTFGFG